MANSTTRSQLVTRVRSAADMANSQFVSDSEIVTWLDVALSELWDILVTTFEDYVESEDTITLENGTTDYALPDDFYKLLSADLESNGVKYTLRRFMHRERNYRANSSPIGIGDYQYRVVGSTIRFIPTPMVSQTVTLKYIPQYTPMAADDTVVNSAIPQGWEEYAVLDAAIQCLLKEETDPSALMARKQQLAARIASAAADRDANAPARIADVGRRFVRYWDEWNEGF